MGRPTPSTRSDESSTSSSSPRSSAKRLEEARTQAQLDLIIDLVREGVSLAPISRATGIPLVQLTDALQEVPDLVRTARVLSGDELGQEAGKVAKRALDEAMRILNEGSEVNKIRLITSILGHPLRRMQTDSSAQVTQMKGLLEQILVGPDAEEDDGLGGPEDDDA